MAIDPGKETGVAFTDGKRWALCMAKDRPGEAFRADANVLALSRGTKGDPEIMAAMVDLVVVESYTPQTWRRDKYGNALAPKGAREQSRRVERLTQYAAANGILCCVQNSEDLRGVSDSEIRLVLAGAGIKTTNEHERAAARHAWIALARFGR